jgi:Rps23 Pro-64 3,4-dihydroxylase Tpa1-like proline 4-hydroxylase
MRHKLYKDPFTFIVLENWLDPVYVHQMFNEVKRLNTYMKPSVVYGNGKIVHNKNYKSSHNLWLYDHYRVNPFDDWNLCEKFESALWTNEIKRALRESGDALFQTALYSDHSQVLLSRYDQGDHYDWHRDYNDTITINYMIGQDTNNFTGGDFQFGTWDSDEVTHTIPFKNNTLLIFPSRVRHRVTPVENLTGGPENARYTIQYWCKLKQVFER